MISFAGTDVGRIRSRNEDFVFASDSPIGRLPNLYIVADGMGGHNGGEVASREAVSAFVKFAKYAGGEITDTLAEAAKEANNAVLRISKENPVLKHMGTTLDGVSIDGERVYIAHIGDSRVYLINSEIQRLTTDHSYVMDLVRAGIISLEEADKHPDKNIITRAIGVEDDIECDVIIARIKEGDYILLCSDGLSNMLEDKTIYELIANNDFSVKDKVNLLIDKANQNGGKDNISVVLIRCGGDCCES